VARMIRRSLARLLASRRAKLLVALVVGLAVTGSVLAYYTSTGSGTGTARVATTQAVTISAASPTAALYPGGSADVAASISNPNSVAVHLPSLALDTNQGAGGFDVDTAHKNAGCTVAAAALSYTTQTNSGGDFIVPAKVGITNGRLDVDLTGAISMGADAANACQGATFTVYLKVGP
jgi:hypothetical protein